MNHILRYTGRILFLLLCLLPIACSDDTLPDDKPQTGEPLNLSVSFGAMTRVAELGSPDAMNEATESGTLKNVGLYIYYTDDYKKGDLTRPYIRNLECHIVGGQLKPLTDEAIYIYDRMTIVAFYPYNANVGKLTNKSEEEKYPITMGDYSQQTYIPYRAQLETNPTIAYAAKLHFAPKHTAKIEVVFVSATPIPNYTNPQLLPAIDTVNASTGDHREQMIDGNTLYPKNNTSPLGGCYARQYTAYIWKTKTTDSHHDTNEKHNDNTIRQGDLLFKSDEITLFASQNVEISEDRIYRYGYNINTGEVFIPTSTELIVDATSLQAMSLNDHSVYQVCDINLSGEWTPLKTFKGSYDGGGHKITGLKITNPPTGLLEVGLFGRIIAGSTLRNINLENPIIELDFGTNKDTIAVGALCGRNNKDLDEADKEALKASLNLPAGMSEVVVQALLDELIAGLSQSPCNIIACRVNNPEIKISGQNLRVGTLCGINGDEESKGNITDAYALWGTIALNGTTPHDNNKDCNAGGFCGLNTAKGQIKRCYTTSIAAAAANTTAGTPPVTTTKEYADGFAASEKGAIFTECYSSSPTATATLFSKKQPDWNIYTGKWPVYINDWNGDSASGNHSYFWQSLNATNGEYPQLVWER
ncbi:MAG: hypothetical protein RSA53_07565 [Odoribacter sp.]